MGFIDSVTRKNLLPLSIRKEKSSSVCINVCFSVMQRTLKLCGALCFSESCHLLHYISDLVAVGAPGRKFKNSKIHIFPLYCHFVTPDAIINNQNNEPTRGQLSESVGVIHAKYSCRSSSPVRQIMQSWGLVSGYTLKDQSHQTNLSKMTNSTKKAS